MEILYVILGLLIVWLGVSIYVIKNLLSKLEKFEDFTEEFNSELYKVDDALKAIDSKGSFRACYEGSGKVFIYTSTNRS